MTCNDSLKNINIDNFEEDYLTFSERRNVEYSEVCLFFADL